MCFRSMGGHISPHAHIHLQDTMLVWEPQDTEVGPWSPVADCFVDSVMKGNQKENKMLMLVLSCELMVELNGERCQ